MEIQYFTECIIYTLISRYMAVICIRITCIADVMLGNCKKCILQCKKEAEEKKKKKCIFKRTVWIQQIQRSRLPLPLTILKASIDFFFPSIPISL